MSMLTLEEAISHALEVAEQEECFINYPHSDIVLGDLDIESRKHYVAEQKQLAEWLMEYKDLKAEQNDQYVFIHELMSELKEAKRLLKAAVEDLNFESQCRNCKHKEYGLNTVCKECRGNKYKWRYADEAEKLIES